MKDIALSERLARALEDTPPGPGYARRLAEQLERTAPRPVGPCPCECNANPPQFCGGCGHAGCGGRRVEPRTCTSCGKPLDAAHDLTD